ncbi:LRR-GTPase of the ROCO family [Pelomyxa schiedti]|nr:LRR-GTPase of the ROCO family [Pelomyxa schiedti]
MNVSLFAAVVVVAVSLSDLACGAPECTFDEEVEVLCEMYTMYSGLWRTNPCNFSLPCEQPLEGITCYTDVEEEDHVQKLILKGTLLYSLFPECVVRLCYLQSMDFSVTLVEGTLPASIGSMAYLNEIWMNGNYFSGAIPSSIGLMPSLLILDLSENYFSGAIPQSIGSLTTLTYLDLSKNQLQGLLPDTLRKLLDITYMDFSSNQLSGNLPNFEASPIQALYLQDNRFSGQIPSNIANPHSLQDVDLSHNQFSGTIPPEMGDIDELFALNLAENSLTGPIPFSFNDLQYISFLDLSQNQLSGEIPPSLGKEFLIFLDLSSNKLSGSIPVHLGNLSLIQYIDLSINQLSGTIPEFTSSLMTALHLYENELSGTIPASISFLSSLQYLDLNSNHLEGSIPDSIGDLENLFSINLSVNFLEGSIPTTLGKMPALEAIDFSNNNLHGAIPEEFGLISTLQTINLRENEISSTIPSTLVQLTVLSSFLVSSNLIQGNISSTLVDYLLTVSSCDLSSNCVECGPIGPCQCNESREGALCSCVQGDSCYIDEKCYSDGEQSKVDCHQVCNVTFSQLDWLQNECVPKAEIFVVSLILVILICVAVTVTIVVVRIKVHKKPEESRLLLINSEESRLVEHFPLSLSVETLTFGLSGVKAPMEQTINEIIEITNTSANVLQYRLRHEPSEKFDLWFEPQSGSLKPHESSTFTIYLNFHCTTKAQLQVRVETTDNDGETVHKFLCGHVDSKLSTRLDYDELEVKLPPIGDGGYGVVYKGTWRGTDVAVKVLKYQDLDDVSLAEFKREIRMMEDIRSTYCINFLGAVVTPGKYCIVTEFCEYGSLASTLHKYHLCLCLRFKMALDAAKGMNYLHSNGIIHRDFKPDNLLVTSLLLDAPVNCKITDFGTTREINETESNKYTLGIGTIMYHAPELFIPAAEGVYNQSCDVFSYAIALYELYTEQTAYPLQTFKTFFQVSQYVLEGNRRPIPPDCPAKCAALITDCWAHEPSNRPGFKEIEARILEIHNDARKDVDPSAPTFEVRTAATRHPDSL